MRFIHVRVPGYSHLSKHLTVLLWINLCSAVNLIKKNEPVDGEMQRRTREKPREETVRDYETANCYIMS